MMMLFSLVLWTMCHGWTIAAKGASPAVPAKKFQLPPRMETNLLAAKQLLWRTYPSNVRIEENFLFFHVPFIRDVAFLQSLRSAGSKAGGQKTTLPLYVGVEEDLRSFGNELKRATNNNVQFKTILYTTSTEFNKTMAATINRVYKNPDDPKNSFLVVVYSGAQKLQLWTLLSRAVEESNLTRTCEARYCGIWKIMSTQPSFSMITLASWRVRHAAGFQWTEWAKFVFYETSTMDVQTLRSVAKYDYAEFKYPQLPGCVGRALRLQYNPDLYLTFVIPGKSCSSILEEQWKNFRDVDLSGLKYNNQEMFVSIPVFKVSSIINLAWTLKGTDLGKVFTSNSSSTLHQPLAFLATEFIFDPKPPPSKTRPTISPKTPEFHVNRPFFISISHVSSRATVFTGLVLYPGCIKQCMNQPINANK